MAASTSAQGDRGKASGMIGQTIWNDQFALVNKAPQE